jgi:imidazolonepropionase-like amidohydrolase
MLEILPSANKAGVRLVLGDDYGAVPLDHGCYADELVFYVEHAGIPVLDVIRWGTKNGGELLHRTDSLGTIADGKIADLIVVDGDPISDIRVLTKPDKLLAVMLGGKFATSKLQASDIQNSKVLKIHR